MKKFMLLTDNFEAAGRLTCLGLSESLTQAKEKAQECYDLCRKNNGDNDEENLTWYEREDKTHWDADEEWSGQIWTIQELDI